MSGVGEVRMREPIVLTSALYHVALTVRQFTPYVRCIIKSSKVSMRVVLK